jgi:hypothetical protein
MSQNKMEASFSTLVLSIGSMAAMSLGLAPDPQSGQTKIDLHSAKFNIDLLNVLSEKTAKNLSADETNLLEKMITDLQLRYVQTSSK